MNARWYYSHAETTHGPFSVQEIKECIARKILLESDLVWQDGADDRLRADSVFDFSPPAAVAPVPDWLADVVEVEEKRGLATPAVIQETPEWLEDLRLWVALEQYEPGWETFNKTAERSASTPAQAGSMPDWLANWNPPAAQKEAAANTPPRPIVPVPVPVLPPVVPAVAPPVAPAPAKTLAEQMLEASGFDPDTGQILDAEKFRQWKQMQARSAGATHGGVSNASLFEVFRQGRTAIESWVDDEKNRLCVLHADPDELKRNRGVQAILDAYANYGQAFQEKLLRHLEFMVENRQKYYRALDGRSS